MGKIVGFPMVVLGVLYNFIFIEKLASGEWRVWLFEFKKFLRKEKCWTGIVVETVLDFLGTVTIPARTEIFFAKDHFVNDTGKNTRVKISYLGGNFQNNFLDKTEGPIIETVLQYHRLKKSSKDILIINELGGDDKAEAKLAEMFSLMEKQPNGEDGDLITNVSLNIFYIRDKDCILRTVFCFWCNDGWYVDADSVGYPRRWYTDCRVFSRNS